MAAAAKKGYKKIVGSKPGLLQGYRAVEDPAFSNKPIKITIKLKHNPATASKREEIEKSLLHAQPHKHLSRDEYESVFGAALDDIDKIEKFAAANNLTVVGKNVPARSITLSGTVAAMNQAFGVALKKIAHDEFPGRQFRAHEKELAVPTALHNIVSSISGLNTQPVLRKKWAVECFCMTPDRKKIPAPFGEPGLLPTDIAFNEKHKYCFPKGLTGKGQSIAIFADANARFNDNIREAIANYLKYEIGIKKCPNIIPVFPDDEGENSQVEADAVPEYFVDMELYQDIELIGAIAPEADIYIYFSGSSGGGIRDTISKMIHNKEHPHSILCISYVIGENDPNMSEKIKQEIIDEFKNADAMGISVFVATGDGGSNNCFFDGDPHVNLLTASPHVTACGGTQFKDHDPKKAVEVVLNEFFQVKPYNTIYKANCATGGGQSTRTDCSRPQYQVKAEIQLVDDKGKVIPPQSGVSGRLTPDIAAFGSALPGYKIGIYDVNSPNKYRIVPGGGTSVAAPLYAALTALINQKRAETYGQNAGDSGKLGIGCLNKILYELGKKGQAEGIFNDITQGDNDLEDQLGLYGTTEGWDACTGWGTVNGTKLMEYVLNKKY